MDRLQTKSYFQHSWWRIALIVMSLVTFVVVCVFNGLAGTGPNGVFTQQTGRVSDSNLTEFTPAGWTFSIWGLIYFWQAAWMIYALSRIPRKSNAGYLYLAPDTLNPTVFVLYITNLLLNIVWLILWDRGYFGWGFVIIALMFVTVIAPMIITHILLQRHRSDYVESDRKLDIWLVRMLVHNGLAIYGTWLFLATLLNLTIWISSIYNRDPQSITNITTIVITIVLAGIIIYFVCENFIFYSSMAYTFTPWFVLIFALIGILSKNYKRKDIPSRNQSYALALLILCCVLGVVRVGIFAFRYITKRIPTIRDP